MRCKLWRRSLARVSTTRSEGFPVPQLFRALRVCAGAVVLSVLALPPASASTLNVPAGGDLQAALNSAQPGDVILLASGATYTGNFQLPFKAGTQVITVRTDAPAGSLPAAGVRITPDYAPALAKIKSPNTAPALTTAARAQDWRLELLEFQANVGGHGDIIVLGSASQTQVSDMPHDLVLDRVYIHGDPIAGQKRGIALQSGYTQITNSYIADIKAAGQDSQAICGWNGSGPYVIENNYLEAAAENLLFGGADPAVPGLVPSDISIRGNLFSKPLTWRQENWTVKNALELKNASRVLVEGNIIENVWRAGQNGFAVVFTPRNQDGKSPWSLVTDVTVRYNIVRHANGAFNLEGWDDEHNSAQMQRVRISNNVVYDINTDNWGGDNGIFLQIGNNPRDVTIDSNTVNHSGSVISAYGKQNGQPWPTDGFVFRDNLLRHNQYGVKGDGTGTGAATLRAYFTSLTFDRNVLAGGSAGQYPGGNYFPTVADFLASFVDPANGDFTLVPGSSFATSSSTGGALGADVARVTAAVTGVTTPAPSATGPSQPTTGTADSTGREATCRAGVTCGAPPASRPRN